MFPKGYQMVEDRFAQIRLGEEAEIFHTITEADVDTFSRMTGDTNPLHMDDDFAAKTSFKKRVVHGMLTASFISTMIGAKLPGVGAMWYEQNMRFLSPVRIGEKIRVFAKVKHKSLSQRIIVLETVVFNEEGKKVIEGQAKVKMLKLETGPDAQSTDEETSKGAVIISGAGRGIGAAIAKALAAEGHPVVINYKSSSSEAEHTANEIFENNGQALVYQADIADQEAVRKMVKFTLSECGRIAGVVNNASSPIESKEFLDLVWEDMERHIQVQLKGAFNLCQAVLEHLVNNKNGVIINIGSIAPDNVPSPKQTPYNMAKSALITLTRSLAGEYGPKGVRVNCISPGMTLTDLIADMPEKAKMMNKMQTPMRRLAQPEDIAHIAAFLFSGKAQFITGQNIRACGGMVMS